MTNNIIVDLSMDFAVSIVKLSKSIKGKSVLTNVKITAGVRLAAIFFVFDALAKMISLCYNRKKQTR